MGMKTDSAQVISFNEALKKAGDKKHLLLGNGFSIALKPDIFSYASLYEECEKQEYISKKMALVFKKFKTKDFEVIIRALNDAAIILNCYTKKRKFSRQLKKDADKLKTALVNLLSSKHPAKPSEIPDPKYSACVDFLSHFERIYTLNYDLLLCWAIMKAIETGKGHYDDGFRHEPNEDYVVWQPEEADKQNVYYLHGALHLFDAGSEIKKFTWNRTGVTLLRQVKSELEKNNFPLFVAEGTSREKMTKINHSQYLGRGVRSFSKIGGSLFIFGHSLSKNDGHYLSLIAKNNLNRLFISLYDSGTRGAERANREIRTKADLLVNARSKENPKKPLDVSFFDAQTAKVWG